MKKRVAVAVLVSLVTSFSVVAVATPAMAATVSVTTASDVVDGADGVVSLREAVTQANAAADATTIDLAASVVYALTLCGDDDANAVGDLDLTGMNDVTVNGNGSTIQQTCAGERLIDQLDSAPTVMITNLTLTGGDSTDGAAVRFNGDVELVGATISGNDAATGPVLNSGEFGSGSSIALVDSTLGPNTGTGIRVSFDPQAYVSERGRS
jgi:hypothetical protein